MTDLDFFDITWLPFDPPEKNVKKVKLAVEKAEKSLGASLGSETQQIKRDEINAKITLLQQVKDQIFSSDGKLTEYYSELAQRKTDEAKSELEIAVKFKKITEVDPVFTNGTIRTQKQKRKLSTDSVREVYEKHGFVFKEIDPLAAYPKFPTNSEKIHRELAEFRSDKNKDPNPEAVDQTKAFDLYGFVAYTQGEPNNAASYRTKDNKELTGILDSFCRANAQRNDNLGKLCVSIATSGKTYVFNSPDNRKAYDMFLLYKSPELEELFEIIKGTTKSDLYESRFADRCIQEIAKVFSNSEISLAIYNFEAGLKDDPYIPESRLPFYVKCPSCMSLCEFNSFNDAQTKNECIHCHHVLYKQCLNPNCKKAVLYNADICPECGFIFSNIETFVKKFALAEKSLRTGRFDDARQYLIEAELANPGEHAKIQSLKVQIEKEESKYGEPLNKLKLLFSKRQFEIAQKFLTDLMIKYPNLNVSEYELQIKQVLDNCRDSYVRLQNSDRITKINTCLEILNTCSDYKLAIDYLRTELPILNGSLSHTVNNIDCTVSLSWNQTNEIGVTFCLVRKVGKEAPISINDGEIIVDNYESLSFKDEKIIPGMWYSYSIFAKRRDAVSKPISTSAIVLAQVTDLKYIQNGNTIRLFWTSPNNCDGVEVICVSDGQQRIISNNANCSVDDCNIQYNKRYLYTLKSIYRNIGKSEGVQLSVLPTVVVNDFKIIGKQLKDNTYSISWSILQQGVDIQIVVNGKNVQKSISDNKECQVVLASNGYYTIYANAYSGGGWLKSQNEIEINTFPPCEIDSKNSVISEETVSTPKSIVSKIKLSIKLASAIPQNVVSIAYFVRTKHDSTSSAPWATADEIKKSDDCHIVDLSAYIQNKEIVYTTTAKNEETYYITLFAIYSIAGKEIHSAPCKKKFNRPLKADVFWRVNRSFLGAKKFSMSITPNRPFLRRPHLILCVSSTGKHLLSVHDAAAKCILDLPEQYFENPKQKYDVTSDINEDVIKNQKVFLFEEDGVDSEEFTLRWADGFDGKI